jgi:nitroreductase
MTVTEAIEQRFSVRAYQAKPVEEPQLRQVLEAARLAPSGGNRQEWRFVVVRDAATRARLAQAACGQAFVGQAPVVIAACAAEEPEPRAYPLDVSIAVAYMTLQATELGLGTCWIGAFHEAEVREVLGVPAEVRVVALLPLGYPAADPPEKQRLPLEEIVKWEKWE